MSKGQGGALSSGVIAGHGQPLVRGRSGIAIHGIDLPPLGMYVHSVDVMWLGRMWSPCATVHVVNVDRRTSNVPYTTPYSTTTLYTLTDPMDKLDQENYCYFLLLSVVYLNFYQ